MSDLFDKSLLCWEKRRDCLVKLIKRQAPLDSNIMVWVLGKDGKVFGSVIQFLMLRENEISKHHPDHGGLLWWPQEIM